MKTPLQEQEFPYLSKSFQFSHAGSTWRHNGFFDNHNRCVGGIDNSREVLGRQTADTSNAVMSWGL